MSQNRRDWIRQSTLAALGLGISLRSMGNEEGMLRSFGSDKGLVNLGSNENPYGISPMAAKAIQEMMGQANRYPFNVPAFKTFTKEIAEYFQLSEEYLLVTSGSTEALGILPRYYSRGNIVAAYPTFNSLLMMARTIGTPVIEVPLTEEKVHDLPAILKAINKETDLVYIVNPANPTATVLNPSQLKDFCKAVPEKTTILIDEAYIDFPRSPYNESMISLVKSQKNLIVMRTFSKIHGMAGLRVGFIAANPDLIRTFRENLFRFSEYNLSNLSRAAALASLKDEKHRAMTRDKNEAARDYAYQELTKMKFQCIPSFTNFMFFKLGDYPGDFAKDMLKKNIILRSNSYPDGKWGRVSIGTLEEMKIFVDVMKEQFKV